MYKINVQMCYFLKGERMNLDQYRKKQGLTQPEAAAELEVGFSSYVSWELGRRFPCARNLKKIERWSNKEVTAHDLLTANDNQMTTVDQQVV